MANSIINSIVINLQESSNAKEYDFGNRIHQREFDRAINLIDDRISKVSLLKENEKYSTSKLRYNDTISILGSRGSGKTSFLLSLLKYYKLDDKNKDKAEVLDIIDPTLIEEKGHIFLTIISLIEESVSKKLNLSDCSPEDLGYQKKKEWKDMLRKLANGLPSMDGVGSSLEHSDWQDAEFIMDRGLKSVKAAINLEANFNDLVKCALKTLEKKIFIITLDDIDVDFRKGWPVLETIRKYLTSPQIVVLLSGDLKLYSKAIRKQQWKNFGKALLINEGEGLHKNSEYNDLVTEMESQYMQKVIKPENRIRLTTLFEKIKSYKVEVHINRNFNSNIIGSEKNDTLVLNLYKSILAAFGIKNKSQTEIYTSYLLTLPIRTQFQFLLEVQKLIKEETKEKKNQESRNHVKDIDNQNPQFYNEKQIDGNVDVMDAFLSDLFEKEIDVDLARNMPKMLNVIILKLLLKEQVLSEAYQLQPNTTDLSLNTCLMALSFLFSQKVKSNPHLIFDYFIKIGYTRNLLTNIGYAEQKDKKGKSLLKPSIEGLCFYSGMFQDKVLRDVVGNITAYVESIPNSNQNRNGIIHLYATAHKDKNSNEKSKGRIDYEFGFRGSKLTTLQQTLAFIPLSILEFIEKRASSLTFSIYTLLGSIGELIRKIDVNDMENGLLELSQWRTYPMVSFEKSLINLSDESEYQEIKPIKDNSGNTELIMWFKEWHNEFFKMDKRYSPYLLGKISTRTYYSFNSIRTLKECNLNLGVAMHRRLIALLNSILIEDVRENCNNIQGLNINNSISSDNIFINNLRFANSKIDSDFGFSKWLLRCPLFLLYLDDEILKEEAFVKYIFDGKRERMMPFERNSIYEKLTNINIKESGIDTNTRQDGKISFSTDYSKIEQVASTLQSNGLTYSNFEKIGLSDFNKIYSNLFSNRVNNSRLNIFKSRIKEKGLGW